MQPQLPVTFKRSLPNILHQVRVRTNSKSTCSHTQTHTLYMVLYTVYTVYTVLLFYCHILRHPLTQQLNSAQFRMFHLDYRFHISLTAAIIRFTCQNKLAWSSWQWKCAWALKQKQSIMCKNPQETLWQKNKQQKKMIKNKYSLSESWFSFPKVEGFPILEQWWFISTWVTVCSLQRICSFPQHILLWRWQAWKKKHWINK